MPSFLHILRLVALCDLRNNLKQKETYVWMFLMPTAFFWFIGTVTGGFGGPPAGPTIALRAGADAGFVADELVARIEAAGGRVVRPDDDPEGTPFEDYRRRLELPDRLTERALEGEAVSLDFRRRDPGPGADFDAFFVQRATYGVLADLTTLDATGIEPTAESVAELRTRERVLDLDVAVAGNLDKVPTGFQQAVPGILVMFTLVVLLSSCATQLITERRSGVLVRLAASPVPRASLAAGKWFGSLLLAAIQIAFATVVGRLGFGVDWGPHWPMVLVVLFAFAALVSSLSLLLGNLARTEQQAIGLAVIAGNTLGALGGCWWPIEVTPHWMQTLSMCLPTGWTMDALHKLMAFGAPPSAVLPHVVGMLAGAALLGWIASRTLRFR